MTTALITGIAGFVGSHLASYLLGRTDWDIVGLMRYDEPLDNLELLAKRINKGDRIRLVDGDLLDVHSIHDAVTGCWPEYVFHLAAQSYVKHGETAPAKTLRTNGEGTLNLLEALLWHAPNALIHNCSSSEVYGKVEAGYGALTEQTPFHPASIYSISKAQQDALGRYYYEAHGLKVLTTRMFTHTGPRRGDVFMESSFAKQIAMIEAGMIPAVVKVGNLNATRTFADVRDAVKAYHLLLTKDPDPGEVYNIGGTHTCTAADVLETLFRVSGFRCEIELDPERMRPVDADHQVPDCSKFTRHTGWKPEIPFEITMLDLLNYWRDRVKRGVLLQR